MEDLIKNFGINPFLLGAQIVNFLIVLLILKKFAYKPILGMLDKRRKAIEESVENAKKAQEALEKATEEEKKILKKAQQEAKQILDDANTQVETMLADADEKGKKQAEKILADAKEAIKRERLEMEKQLVRKVSDLAVSLLEKSLHGVFTENEQLAVISRVKDKIQS